MQQRYIKIYTKEEVDAVQEKLAKEYKCINTEIFSLGDITIYFEIENYLNMLGSYFTRKDKMYLALMDLEVNEDFVKRFVRK